MNNNEIRYRSCFIVEVIEKDTTIELIDSIGTHYYIYKNDKEVLDNYQDWFTNLFMDALPQSITIITYRTIDISECEFENKIISLKFHTI